MTPLGNLVILVKSLTLNNGSKRPRRKVVVYILRKRNTTVYNHFEVGCVNGLV